MKKNYPNSFVLYNLLTQNNYKIQNKKLIIKYVIDSELSNLKKIEQEFLHYLNTEAHFAIKEIEYFFDKEKQIRILEEENNRKKDIENLMAQSQKMMDATEVYDKKFSVFGQFTNIKDINDESIGSTVNICGEIVQAEKKTLKNNAH